MFLLIAGLVVLGPDRLPGVIRKVGKTYGDIRRAASSFERDFKETFKEPLDELTRTAQEFKAGFGEVDTEPSPPMRPEKAVLPDPPHLDSSEEPET